MTVFVVIPHSQVLFVSELFIQTDGNAVFLVTRSRVSVILASQTVVIPAIPGHVTAGGNEIFP